MHIEDTAETGMTAMCDCIVKRMAAELKTVRRHLAAATSPNGDFISKAALLTELESAMNWGRCTGLADALDIIRAAPAVEKLPGQETEG